MAESHRSVLVDSMAPRFVPEEGTEVSIVSREAFAFVLKTASQSEEYVTTHTAFCTADYQPIERILVSLCSLEQLTAMRARLLAAGLYTPRNAEPLTKQQLHDQDIVRADRFYLQASRKILSTFGIERPKLLETNWSAYDRIQDRRARQRQWFLNAGDIIDYTDEQQRLIFVAADSEDMAKQHYHMQPIR